MIEAIPGIESLAVSPALQTVVHERMSFNHRDSRKISIVTERDCQSFEDRQTPGDSSQCDHARRPSAFQPSRPSIRSTSMARTGAWRSVGQSAPRTRHLAELQVTSPQHGAVIRGARLEAPDLRPAGCRGRRLESDSVDDQCDTEEPFKESLHLA